MTYLETYKLRAESDPKINTAEGDAIDTQVADIREQLTAGKCNIAFLEEKLELYRRDLSREVEHPRGTFPQTAIRAARRYMAIHEVLAVPEVVR